MPCGISEFIELVENNTIGPCPPDFPALVVYLLDIGFAPGSFYYFCPDILQPGKPFPAHLLRQDRHCGTPHEVGIERSTAAIVPRRGPHRLVVRGIESAGDNTGGQTTIRGSHLMGPGRKIFPEQSDNPGLDTGELSGNFHKIDIPIQSAGVLWFVFPCDTEEVEGMMIPQSNSLQLVFNFVRYQLRIFHLGKCR